jgi:SAM-dependent methyltransferase
MKYDNFFIDMRDRRSHTVILAKIKPQSVVLELGCATGLMTDYMKNRLGCKVYICEIDKDSIEKARQYAEGSWFGDLDTLEWVGAFEPLQFDYILCADVLEHLRSPEDVLRETAGLLKDDGSVLMSMPNVAHNSVVLNLLEDRFEYTEVGILDQTHLKFYTYPSLKQLCAGAGYAVVEEDAIYQDYQPVWAEKYPPNVRYRKYCHVMQFIFELKKKRYAEEQQITPVYKIKECPQSKN